MSFEASSGFPTLSVRRSPASPSCLPPSSRPAARHQTLACRAGPVQRRFILSSCVDTSSYIPADMHLRVAALDGKSGVEAAVEEAAVGDGDESARWLV